MKEGYTDITYIMDQSGSMALLDNDVKDGFNSFVKEQQKIPGKLTLTAITFSNTWKYYCYNKDINEVKEMDKFPIGGSTALLDTVGDAIYFKGEQLALMPESERPEKVLFIIFTDGEENISKRFNYKKIKEMIDHQTTKYNWQFSYMGANQDSFTVGNMLGTQANMNWEATSKGHKVMNQTLTNSVATYRCASAGTKYKVVDDFKTFVEELEIDNSIRK